MEREGKGMEEKEEGRERKERGKVDSFSASVM